MNEPQTKAASAIQLYWRKFLVRRSLCCRHLAASKIQSCYRGWFARKHFVSQKQAVVKIQSVFRCLRSLRDVQRYKIATRSAILVQSHVRGWIARRSVRRLKYLIVVLQVAAEHVQLLNAVRSKLSFLVTISDMELMKKKFVMLPREDALLDGLVACGLMEDA